jgi:hypothetical protein
VKPSPHGSELIAGHNIEDNGIMENGPLFLLIRLNIWLPFHPHVHVNCEKNFQLRNYHMYLIFFPYYIVEYIKRMSGIIIALNNYFT